MPTKADVKVELPDGLVTDLIRAEMVKQLGDKEALVEAVVKAALTEKDKTYSRQTMFQRQVITQIQDAGRKVFAEWLNTNKELVRKALLAHLNADKQKRLTEFCERLTEGLLAYNVRVSLSLDDPND